MYVMKQLEHRGIVKLYDTGRTGVMLKSNGSVVGNIAYIVMEYIRGQVLFDLVATLSEHEGLGEVAGRFFMNQLLNTIEYMHNQGIVHRDIKAENIMVDE